MQRQSGASEGHRGRPREQAKSKRAPGTHNHTLRVPFARGGRGREERRTAPQGPQGEVRPQDDAQDLPPSPGEKRAPLSALRPFAADARRKRSGRRGDGPVGPRLDTQPAARIRNPSTARTRPQNPRARRRGPARSRRRPPARMKVLRRDGRALDTPAGRAVSLDRSIPRCALVAGRVRAEGPGLCPNERAPT